MRYLMTFTSGVILASGAIVAVRTADAPHCPTEDSCSVDYSHGSWHITEVRP